MIKIENLEDFLSYNWTKWYTEYRSEYDLVGVVFYKIEYDVSFDNHMIYFYNKRHEKKRSFFVIDRDRKIDDCVVIFEH